MIISKIVVAMYIFVVAGQAIERAEYGWHGAFILSVTAFWVGVLHWDGFWTLP